jgi:hypothetical protein
LIYLPQGLEHGYTIHSEESVRLIVITFPTRPSTGEGWGGFIADVEGQGELITNNVTEP